MKAPRRALLGWAAIVAAVAATVALGAGREDAFDLALYGPLTVIVATSGLLICARHPGHPVGRLFWVLGAWLAVAELGEAYGTHDLPGAVAGEWIISWSWVGEFALWTLILLRFPSGHLPAPRWRWVPWLVAAGAPLAIAGFALGTDDVEQSFADGRNPFAVDALPTTLMFDIGLTLVSIAGLAAIVALALRLRRSTGVERQQLKWFAAAAVLVGAVAPFAVVLWYETVLVQVAMGLALMALPVAAGIAILRYRLYDIDVVIRRTLSYAVLTLTLAGLYLGSVLLAQLFVPARSDLAVALSTLAVAGAFRPLRARVQETVDRRFFRSRFDAQQLLQSFTATVRDEVDLEALRAHLRAAVAETLQPAHVSVWMRR